MKNTLYKLDSKGKLRSWEISVTQNGSGASASVIIKAGLADGKKIETVVEITEGKNIGRSNETTPYAQACLEAQSTYDSKLRSGYCADAGACQQAVLGSGIPAPMLAQKYSPDGSQKSSKTLAQMKLVGERVHVQPKFDGNRCLIKVSADSVELYTRKGDRMLPVPHIEQQIRAAYDSLAETAGDGLYILDGELYTDAFSFNTLNGLMRREEKTAEHLEMLKLVNYHLYDVMGELAYDERRNLFSGFASANIKIVPSFEILATDENIRAKMEDFLSDGFEGLMIRRLDCGYENKRSWSLVKYKDFLDAEYKVVDIIEDARGGIVGAFVLEMDKPTADREGREIKTFRAGIKDLPQDESRKMLANKADFIGRLATVEFFSLSEYNVPRFPKLKGFRADV